MTSSLPSTRPRSDGSSHRATAATGLLDASRPSGCTSFKLRQLARRVGRRYDAALQAATGLKATQYSLLTHVEKLGPLAPGDLARRMALDASTLTRNLQLLAAQGLVRVEAGADQRSRQVVLTPAGCARRAEGRAAWRQAQAGLHAQLGEARVQRLHALIDECMAALAEEGDERES